MKFGIPPGLSAIVHQGRSTRLADVIAGLITGVVLVPQAVAFAHLAGLPAHVGLAASVLPMLAYAILGSSRTLSVGPVSVAALMVGSVVIDYPGQAHIVVPLLALQAALILAALVIMRLEFLTRVFSHSVLSGFTVGAALLIVFNQLLILFNSPKLSAAPLSLAVFQPIVWISLLAVGLLFAYVRYIGPYLQKQIEVGYNKVLIQVNDKLKDSGLNTPANSVFRTTTAILVGRAGPILLILIAFFLFRFYGAAATPPWPTVGKVPANILELSIDWLFAFDQQLFFALLPSGVAIALVSFVESFAVAQTLGQKRREQIELSSELIALSGANTVAAFFAGMPVAGGFSRSMVNFSAGARTQLSSVVAALFVVFILLFASSLFAELPKFTLAAIVIVSIIPLISFKQALHLWRVDRRELLIWLSTLISVFMWGLEQALLVGALLALAVFFARSINPHVAQLGRLPGSQHYKNNLRHVVEPTGTLLLLRFDDALNFVNERSLRSVIQRYLKQSAHIKQVVLDASAINHIDYSGVAALLEIGVDLKEIGVGFHLAHVKGPISDRLAQFGFAHEFQGQIFGTVHAAVESLSDKPMVSAKVTNGD